jgi:hypothetical protein
MLEASLPVTRLSTALDADSWMKRVRSPDPMENDCQLMTVPGALVTVSFAPEGEVRNDAAPVATLGPAGLADAPCPHASITASAIGRSSSRKLIGTRPCGASPRRYPYCPRYR